MRRLQTMDRTGQPSQAKQPATIRCKTSRPMMFMPQAPSFDVVPHRTDRYHATSAAAVCYTQPHPQNMRQPPTATTIVNTTMRARQPPPACRAAELLTLAKPPWTPCVGGPKNRNESPNTKVQTQVAQFTEVAKGRQGSSESLYSPQKS